MIQAAARLFNMQLLTLVLHLVFDGTIAGIVKRNIKIIKCSQRDRRLV